MTFGYVAAKHIARTSEINQQDPSIFLGGSK
jgi:3-oxosteroid 1-dehydrogenase